VNQKNDLIVTVSSSLDERPTRKKNNVRTPRASQQKDLKLITVAQAAKTGWVK